MSVTKGMLAKLNIFTNASKGFLQMVALALKPVLFLKGQHIARAGDIAEELYFISKGRVRATNSLTRVRNIRQSFMMPVDPTTYQSSF